MEQGHSSQSIIQVLTRIFQRLVGDVNPSQNHNVLYALEMGTSAYDPLFIITEAGHDDDGMRHTAITVPDGCSLIQVFTNGTRRSVTSLVIQLQMPYLHVMNTSLLIGGFGLP